jgi:hypothetical protein
MLRTVLLRLAVLQATREDVLLTADELVIDPTDPGRLGSQEGVIRETEETLSARPVEAGRFRARNPQQKTRRLKMRLSDASIVSVLLEASYLRCTPMVTNPCL